MGNRRVGSSLPKLAPEQAFDRAGVRMKKLVIVVGTIIVLALIVRVLLPTRHVAQAGQAWQAGSPMTPDAVDRLLAPVALYPDQLLAQILMSAQNPGNV